MRPSLTVSRKFFEKAVEHEQAPAQFALGRMHELGQAGLWINKDRALELYQLAADQGNDEALEAKISLLSALKRPQEAKEAAQRQHEKKAAEERARVERLATERAEAERLASELAEAERLAAARAKAERLAAERAKFHCCVVM